VWGTRGDEMKTLQTNLVAMCLVAVMFSPISGKAQLVTVPPDETCKGSSTVTVTVFDANASRVPNAFVMLRGGGLEKGEPFKVETTTDADGKAVASVPCGYSDVFAAARGFAPYAEKTLILEDRRSIAVVLKVYLMVEE
jgi:hypothetical protein